MAAQQDSSVSESTSTNTASSTNANAITAATPLPTAILLPGQVTVIAQPVTGTLRNRDDSDVHEAQITPFSQTVETVALEPVVAEPVPRMMQINNPPVRMLNLDLVQLLRYRKAVLWFAWTHLILCLISILQGVINLVMVLGPLCGIKGARQYQKGYVLVYSLFCALRLLILWAMAILTLRAQAEEDSYPTSPQWYVWTVTVVMSVFELYITRMVVRFYSMLRTLDKQEDLQVAQSYAGPVQMVYW